ncbi:MAG: peptidylprolyl isomerase [Cypionkella sp.]
MNAPLFPEITVNGETISSAAIAAEAQNHVAPKGKPGLAWRMAARALTLRKLLLDEAARRGIQAVPASVGPGLTETAEEAQIRALLDEALHVPPPAEEDLVAVWQKDPERYRSPPLWEASHILCAADPADAEAVKSAYLRATAIHAKLTADPKAFGRLAKEVSDCSSKSNGGMLGQLVPGDCVPEFEAALREIEPGQISAPPVRSRFGWHLIRLDACAKGQVLPFAAVRPRLAEAAEKASWTRAARDFAEGLMAAADVKGVDFQIH